MSRMRASHRSRLARQLALLGCGAVLLQVSGCLAGLVPTILNYAQGEVLTSLVGLLGP